VNYDPVIKVLCIKIYKNDFNPLNAELNPICHLLALLGAHPVLHVSRMRVNILLGTAKCNFEKDEKVVDESTYILLLLVLVLVLLLLLLLVLLALQLQYLNVLAFSTYNFHLLRSWM
jgi:hypothetical protein